MEGLWDEVVGGGAAEVGATGEEENAGTEVAVGEGHGIGKLNTIREGDRGELKEKGSGRGRKNVQVTKRNPVFYGNFALGMDDIDETFVGVWVRMSVGGKEQKKGFG